MSPNKKPTVIVGEGSINRDEAAIKGYEASNVRVDEVARMSPIQYHMLLNGTWEVPDIPKAPHKAYFDPPPYKADGSFKRRPR